ncbi:hypothetical protein [Gracilibacillus alcaliphilus]|uniref:hypothetical protein n=1 Tax=Gracilibacillus alcaliphilus TaxID=1401441 RepID=UPI00195A5F16|nr:hypothetical protein [Gracilibacillus alcaliphilus]MBM7675571.1 L-lactate permease [Gracilibacillus alcaliphilus]
MSYSRFRTPLLIGLIILMVLDFSGIIRVPAIVIILLIIGLLWYNIHIRNKAAQGYSSNQKK